MSHESTITSLYSLEGLTPHQYDDLDTHGFTIIHDVIDRSGFKNSEQSLTTL